MAVLHVPFTKMHGAGNDFIVLDNRFFHFSEHDLALLARRFCPRRTGVGADGLLALAPSRLEGTDYRMQYVNADGTPAGLCGNGARCLARFAREAGMRGDPLAFEAAAGIYRASVPAEKGAPVRLFVPLPRDYRPAVRLADGRAVAYIWTGTHHAVRFVDDVDRVEPEREAPAIRRDPAFAPEGVNVNFVEVQGEDAVAVRTFEKGVEQETPACGTGALAAAVVTRLSGRSEADVFTVRAPGGTLVVGLDAADAGIREMFLEGPAETVFTGILEVDPIELT